MDVFCIDSSKILALSSMIFRSMTSKWIKYGAQTVINKSYFSWMPVTDGLREASALGLVFFNISTNDEQKVTENTLINFADYVKLGVQVITVKDRTQTG